MVSRKSALIIGLLLMGFITGFVSRPFVFPLIDEYQNTIVRLSFTNATELIHNITILHTNVAYNSHFIMKGFENGESHYIWFFIWPYNNPNEHTVDLGAVVDIWGPFKGSLWYVEVANFDWEPKQVFIGNTTFNLDTTIFITIQQEN